METLLQDLRYGLRTIMRNRAYAAVAVIALALGIGANTAIFSIVNAVLLRPLPYKDPGKLVMIWEDWRAQGGPEREWTSLPNFQDWRDQSKSFENVSAFMDWQPTLTGQADPEQAPGALVSYNMFSTLGAEPALGRSFRPEEDERGAERIAVISDGLWKRRFGADPAIVGKSVTLDGAPYAIIGVMPANFKFPVINNAQIWTTLKPSFNDGRGCVVLRVIARLKPDAALQQAQSEMSALAAHLAQQYPDSNKDTGILIVGLQEQIVGNVKTPMLVLLGAVGFVLLIACANVANLTLARGAAREKEIAVRSALGASRSRIVRQLLTESLLLALMGAAVGLLLAFWSVDLLLALMPDGAPRMDEISIDGSVLLFTLATAMLTGIIFGIAPAIQFSKTDLNRSLKEGGSWIKGGSRGRRVRALLVVSETAMAMVLLVGAGLLMKSFVALLRTDPGFNPSGVLIMNLGLPDVGYPERAQIRNFRTQLLAQLKSLPGVQATATTSSLPLSGNNTDTGFMIEGRPDPGPGKRPAVWFGAVSTDYFRAMGMRLLKGRLFTDQDNENAPFVTVVSEAMARRYWPDEDPIGKRIKLTKDKPHEIIGVVADVKHFGLAQGTRTMLYLADLQFPSRATAIALRTDADPLSLAPAARRIIEQIDKNLAVSGVTPMEQLMSDSIASQRSLLILIGLFAALALGLATVGIYGVLSYTVAQRTHEIGIRMALGAQKRDVLKLIVGQGMVMAAIGIAVGLAVAFALTQLMESLLYNVRATDPATFAAVSAALALISLIACYIPARRAAKVDPMVALRYE